MRSLRHSVFFTALGLAAIAVTTFLSYRLHLNLAASALVQLLIVLIVALRGGFAAGTIASLAAYLCLWYFVIPPAFSLSVLDPQDWLVLAIFEITALVVSRLSTSAQAAAVKAVSRQRELELLCTFSRLLLLLKPDDDAGAKIVSLIHSTYLVDSVVLFEAAKEKIHREGQYHLSLETRAKNAYRFGLDSESPALNLWLRLVRADGNSLGALAIQGGSVTARGADTLASLTAISLARVASLAREAQAEAEKQSDRLRTTVLEALAHDFKTPLTTIRTASSSLLVLEHVTGIERQLLALIDGQAERLDEMTNRLLRMSRLDSHQVRLTVETINLQDVVGMVRCNLRYQLPGHNVTVQGLANPLFVDADEDLLVMAIGQLVDNAAKYSLPGSDIEISVTHNNHEIQVSVHNWGPRIPAEDFTRVFQRFFRSAGSGNSVVGTGLGLSITRKVMEAHKGRAWVTSDAESGNTFFLSWPKVSLSRETLSKPVSYENAS